MTEFVPQWWEGEDPCLNTPGFFALSGQDRLACGLYPSEVTSGVTVNEVLWLSGSTRGKFYRILDKHPQIPSSWKESLRGFAAEYLSLDSPGLVELRTFALLALIALRDFLNSGQSMEVFLEGLVQSADSLPPVVIPERKGFDTVLEDTVAHQEPPALILDAEEIDFDNITPPKWRIAGAEPYDPEEAETLTLKVSPLFEHLMGQGEMVNLGLQAKKKLTPELDPESDMETTEISVERLAEHEEQSERIRAQVLALMSRRESKVA